MNENEAFQRGVAHFNAGEFFEAHEAWEELWLVAPKPEKAFLQGFIQVAAAFHHLGRGNMRGTRSLLAAGLAKLAGFPDDHAGLDLVKLSAEMAKCMEQLEAGESVNRLKAPKISPRSRARPKKKRGG